MNSQTQVIFQNGFNPSFEQTPVRVKWISGMGANMPNAFLMCCRDLLRSQNSCGPHPKPTEVSGKTLSLQWTLDQTLTVNPQDVH